MNREQNGLDRFLEGMQREADRKIEKVRIYERPSKVKSFFGFVFSLIFFIIIIGLFSVNVMYFVLLIMSLLVLIFFSINLFTEKGIGLPKNVYYEIVDEEEQPEDEEDDYVEDEEYEDDYVDEDDEEERQ